MFPKCSLDVPNIVTLREHTANIPGILRAGWAVPWNGLKIFLANMSAECWYSCLLRKRTCFLILLSLHWFFKCANSSLYRSIYILCHDTTLKTYLFKLLFLIETLNLTWDNQTNFNKLCPLLPQQNVWKFFNSPFD